MLIEAISTIPEVFDTYLHTSIMKDALKRGTFEFRSYNLHDWGIGNYQKTDDAPFGGGAGQLMMPGPIFDAVRSVSSKGPKPYVVFFTPSGTKFTQRDAERLSEKDRILFVCGRFEGMDERAYTLADECFSLGDFVLTGGELPAMVVTDAIVRLLPGSVGNPDSVVEESFSSEGLLEYAQYTRPSDFEGMKVPEVLLSGNHGAIAEWRRQNSIERTAQMRPDLLQNANLTDKERAFASKVVANNQKQKG